MATLFFEVVRHFFEIKCTITNLGFVFTSLFGIYNTLRNGFSKSFIVAYLGVMFVGFDSWCFHTTLQYEMQLLDELPMIYVACIMVWHTILGSTTCLDHYSIVVSWSYIIINDPVFHQVACALLVLGVVYRATYLFYKAPDAYIYEKPKLQTLLWTAAAEFIIAFILWNIDNQFRPSLRAWRHSVSLLTGSISELHGWWHIGTALDVYYFIVFCEWIRPVLAANDEKYILHWFGPICYLRPAAATAKKD